MNKQDIEPWQTWDKHTKIKVGTFFNELFNGSN